MLIDDFVRLVREVTQVPDDDEDITEDFILRQGYLALLERFTQPIITLRNGTWLHSYTFQTTAGVSRYRLPPRSIAQGLEKIECAVTQGSNMSQWYLLNVQTNVQATDYEGLAYHGRPVAFTYLGDTVNIFPTPADGWTLRVFYYLRPSPLICRARFEEEYAGNYVTGVTHVDGNQYLITGLNNWSHGDEPFRLDMQFTDGNSEMLATDVVARSQPPQLNLLLVELDANIADIIARSSSPGSYKIIAGLSERPTPYIPLPQEMCNALVSYVGAVVLATKGDSDKAQVFSQKAEVAIKNIVDVALPRSKGQPSVFKTRNTYLRRRVGRWGWGGGWGHF